MDELQENLTEKILEGIREAMYTEVYMNIDEALIEAATMGDEYELQKAIDGGADVHAKDDEAICIASKKGYAKCVRLLLMLSA